jgi:predicted HD superfamily hydrolase involved in NAD metabolism
LIAGICERLCKMMTPVRYQHSLGVMKLAEELANLYGVEPEKAALAGVLHDVAREIPSVQLLAEARLKGIEIDELEERVPVLLHGKVGAAHARDDFNINDQDILEAISLHITGNSIMSILAQIVFMADFAELNRKFGSARFARDLCRISRVSALEYVFNQEILFVINQGYILHPKTLEARNRLLIHGDLAGSQEMEVR